MKPRPCVVGSWTKACTILENFLCLFSVLHFPIVLFSYVVLDHGAIFLKCLSFLGVKIFGKGASVLTGLAEIIKKALKG
jgi:hypothetical protein